MSSAEEKILNQKISELTLTDDFKKISSKLGYSTLKQMANEQVADLLKMDGFNYHILQEFVQFMQENNLSHLIKQR